jgi:hypothetical protein
MVLIFVIIIDILLVVSIVSVFFNNVLDCFLFYVQRLLFSRDFLIFESYHAAYISINILLDNVRILVIVGCHIYFPSFMLNSLSFMFSYAIYLFIL